MNTIWSVPAREAYERGDSVFQCSARTGDNASATLLLNSVADVGWDIVAASFVHEPESYGTTGYYVFRARR